MADAQLPFAACLETLAQRVPQHLRPPKVGIICGSGLSTLAESLTDTVYVPYGELPGFGISTGTISSRIRPHHKIQNSYTVVVQGHKSSLVFGLSGGVPVVAMLGRVRDRGAPYHLDPILIWLMIPVPRIRRPCIPNNHVSGSNYGQVGCQEHRR